MSNIIPVISLYQPWAQWVALGWKSVETRTHNRFKGLLGKTIGIHAGLRYDEHALLAAHRYMSDEEVRATEKFLRIGGAIICTAKVIEYRKCVASDSPQALIECERTERYGLFLTNIRAIPTVISKGRQGIWYVDIEERR